MRPLRSPVSLPVAAVCIVVALAVSAAPAGAHTGFDSAEPAPGSVVADPVHIVTLVFTGEAEPVGAGFEILDAAGTVRTPAAATSTDGATWVLRFDPPLAGGTVGVRWRVKAPDAHPIDGSFSFDVTGPAPADGLDAEPAAAPAGRNLAAAPPAADGLDAFLDTDADPSAIPRRVGAGARMVTLIGTLVGVGALIFAAAVLRGPRRDVRQVLYWVRWAGILVVLGATAELVAQLGVEARGWAGLRSPTTVFSVLVSPFGMAVTLRIGGGLALAAGARLEIIDATAAPDPVVAIRELVGVGSGPGNAEADAPRHSGAAGGHRLVHDDDQAWLPTVGSAGAIGGAAALVAAHLFDGHTVTEGHRFWTGLTDVVHVAAGAAWAGGVLMLAVVLWHRHRHGRDLRALDLAVRFSVVATGALVAVGAAGLALTVIVLDSPADLWGTEWGRTLAAKTGFVALAAAAGGYNHEVLIPQMERAPRDPALAHRFRLVVTAEAVALVAVLVSTALLMGAAS